MRRSCLRSSTTCTIPWHAEACRLYESGLPPRKIAALMQGKHDPIHITPPRVSQVVTWHELPRHRRVRKLADIKRVFDLVKGGLSVKPAAQRTGIAADGLLYSRLRQMGWAPGMHKTKQRGIVFAGLCLGLTHREVAEEAGVSVATVSRWRRQFGIFHSKKTPRQPATGGARGGFGAEEPARGRVERSAASRRVVGT